MAENEKNTSIEVVRRTVQALGEDGKEISYPLIFESLGIEEEAQKAKVRSHMFTMARHGEVTLTGPGTFLYHFKTQPRPSKMHAIIWRFVRAAKPGWSIQDCSMMTRASYTHSLRYISWLESEGYIQCMGRNERNGKTFRNTEKARRSPQTPYPPIRATDPFAKERVAAATITRLMLCADPYSHKTASDICAACHVLLARFEKTTAENRNENENEEDNHVE